MDDASKTTDIKYVKVEKWLLFAHPNQHFWLGAWFLHED